MKLEKKIEVELAWSTGNYNSQVFKKCVCVHARIYLEQQTFY